MVSWAALLDEAVKKPGFIHEAYSRFHNYSLGNQLLALFQCIERGIQPGPLATFPKWKELGARRRYGSTMLFFADSRSPRTGCWVVGIGPTVEERNGSVGQRFHALCGLHPERKSFSRLWVAQISCHSACTFPSPRSRNLRNPRASLICPKTGSTTALRSL